MTAGSYPERATERTRWILDQRPGRNEVPEDLPYAFFAEEEPESGDGSVARVAAIFLTNRECPWKCLMCDLWRNTRPVGPGSIPRQIAHALDRLPNVSVLKLYNSGSFFDQGAIPRSDWREIARLCTGFDRVILECHPRLVGSSVLEFAALVDTKLEIAMGLETCHPGALERLNKRITPAQFADAARFLRGQGIAVRTFLLVGVPFLAEEEQQPWLERSINFAFDAGSDIISLIPTRAGNGALDQLESEGAFREPRLSELESAHAFGIQLGRGLVFADTWDLERFSRCTRCAGPRAQRLRRMNLSQRIEPRIACSCET